MLPYRDSRITTVILGIFFILAILYALFEARGQLIGPIIEVNTRAGMIEDPLLIVEGQTERISLLTMNGREIPVTEDGAFREPYLLAPGYNRIVLAAEDSYGKSTERVLEIMYASEESQQPSTTIVPSYATSTPTSGTGAGEVEFMSTTTTSTTIEAQASSSTVPVAQP